MQSCGIITGIQRVKSMLEEDDSWEQGIEEDAIEEVQGEEEEYDEEDAAAVHGERAPNQQDLQLAVFDKLTHNIDQRVRQKNIKEDIK